MQIENLIKIGANGEVVPEVMSQEERSRLYPPLGIVKIVKLTWIYDGLPYELDLITEDRKIVYELLPDRSGFLLTTRDASGATSAAVLNADLSIRFSLNNPWPTSPFFRADQKYEFVWPTLEQGQPGFIISVSSTGPTDALTTVEHFFAVNPDTGMFTGSHPVR